MSQNVEWPDKDNMAVITPERNSGHEQSRNRGINRMTETKPSRWAEEQNRAEEEPMTLKTDQKKLFRQNMRARERLKLCLRGLWDNGKPRNPRRAERVQG